MEDVQIVYVDERNGKHGPYTRVGYRGKDGKTTFVNVDGHHGLRQGPAKWDPERKEFKQDSSSRYRLPTPPEERKSINRSVALGQATEVVTALIGAGVISSRQEAMEEIRSLFTEMLELLEG